MSKESIDEAAKEDLRAKGRVLLEAAHDYWSAYKRAVGGAAVVWLEDDYGRLVVFTRGEYRDEILWNITPLLDRIHLGEEPRS